MKALRNSLIALAVLLPTQAAFAQSDIRLIDPWVRAPRPGSDVTAGFMILQNDGKNNDALVSVSSPIAKIMEIHKTSEKDGMMRMQKVDRIDLPAGEKVTLQPGGYHIMLFKVDETNQDLKQGWVPLTLNFEKSEPMTFKAPLRSLAQAHKHNSKKSKSKQ